MDNKSIKMLDDYLAGKLNANQVAELEALAAVDPSFNQNLVNQQEVVEGISSFRKAQLKARLDNVVIAESSSLWTKVLVGVSTCVLIASGVWVLNDKEHENPQVEVKAPIKVEQVVKIEKVESARERFLEEQAAEESPTVVVKPVKVASTTAVTSLNLPTVVTNENELLIDEDVDKEASSANSPLELSGYEMSIVSENVSGRFHYKYRNGNVLVQIADYSISNQATLIEYADRHQVYMEYQDNFYELSQTSSWSALERTLITDQNVISELNARLK